VKYFMTNFVLVLGLVMTVPAPLWAMSSSGEPTRAYHPQVRETRGPVMIKGAKYSLWEPAEKGMLLLSGDVLRTEKGGYARVEFASGVIELYETSVLVIPSIGVQDRKKDIQEVVVEEGKALFDINPLGVERGFQFRTKNIQGGVKGTLFTVSFLEGGSAVNVYRGVVQVSDPARTEETRVELKAGKSVRVEKRADFKKVSGFDPSVALEDYQHRVPPGLNGKGLPADNNANPRNKGIRKRGGGKPGNNLNPDIRSISNNDQNDQGQDLQ